MTILILLQASIWLSKSACLYWLFLEQQSLETMLFPEAISITKPIDWRAFLYNGDLNSPGVRALTCKPMAVIAPGDKECLRRGVMLTPSGHTRCLGVVDQSTMT